MTTLTPARAIVAVRPGGRGFQERWWADVSAGWEWGDMLFAGTAAHYRRGRLPYAPGLVDVLTEVLNLDGRGRLVDVGCGPGTLTLMPARLFSEVVGVGPDGGAPDLAFQVRDVHQDPTGPEPVPDGRRHRVAVHPVKRVPRPEPASTSAVTKAMISSPAVSTCTAGHRKANTSLTAACERGRRGGLADWRT